ncbi:MAG: DUF2238 domain-containing protein, partial [Nanoarchaeota archaeon]|nr:DUF2238 domain-containing protein [Nanoarchaeota archaeon]
IVFLIFSILMGINPNYRYVWFVENIILIVFLLFMLIFYRYFKFSNLSYTLIFIFCVFQTIGAHYTYAEVPFGFITTLFDFERNNYDRLVHFLFGFLLAFPFREVLIKTSTLKYGFWTFMIPIFAAFACGSFYEVLEWTSAETILKSESDDASLFLGAQGDIWDAEKDMFLAGLGSILAMLITLSFRRKKDIS